MKALTSSQVARVAGCSLRQLQWWDEQGLVVPEMIKHNRWYTQEKLWEVEVVLAAKRAGLSLQKIGTLLRNKLLQADKDYCVIAGMQFGFYDTELGAIEALVRAGRPGVILPLKEIRSQMSEKIGRLEENERRRHDP